MKVTINRGTADPENTIETSVETVDTPNNKKDSTKEGVVSLKPNAFTLFEYFRHSFYYVNIDDVIVEYQEPCRAKIYF